IGIRRQSPPGLSVLTPTLSPRCMCVTAWHCGGVLWRLVKLRLSMNWVSSSRSSGEIAGKPGAPASLGLLRLGWQIRRSDIWEPLMELDWSEQSPHIRTLFCPWQPGDGYDEMTVQAAEERLGI